MKTINDRFREYIMSIPKQNNIGTISEKTANIYAGVLELPLSTFGISEYGEKSSIDIRSISELKKLEERCKEYIVKLNKEVADDQKKLEDAEEEIKNAKTKAAKTKAKKKKTEAKEELDKAKSKEIKKNGTDQRVTENTISIAFNHFYNFLEHVGINTILYGPPGTGKTYSSVYYAVSAIKGVSVLDLKKEKYDDVLKSYNKYKELGQIEFVTFHQSYGYEEFIEGIRPDLSNNNDSEGIKYKLEDGVFKRFCKRAKSDKDKNFVFVIDEINRGNISNIFGELITLIEPSKRIDSEDGEGITAVLPYSHEAFGVPANVYILGTMNTADRSIATLDTALRRRFDFVELMPDTSVLEGVTVKDGDAEVDIAVMLDKINERIEYLYDREHTLGQAFFIPLKDKNMQYIGVLASIFKNKVLPLLQEYFFDDWEQIRLVLGDNKKNEENQFITKKGDSYYDLFGENTDGEEKIRYCINEKALRKIDAYRGIIK